MKTLFLAFSLIIALTTAKMLEKSEDTIEIIKEKVNTLPYLKESYQNNKELIDNPQLIQTLEIPSISKYQQSIQIDFNKGIVNDKHSLWIERIMTKLGLPKEFKDTLDNIAESDDKLKMTSLAWFDEKTKSNSYVLILDDYCRNNTKFNFIYAKIDTFVETEITIIKNYSGNGTITVEHKKDNVTKIEAEMYMEYFEIVALTKIASYLGIPIPEKSIIATPYMLPQLKFLMVDAGPIDTADAALKIANGVVDLFDKLGKVFGSSTSTSLKEIIKGEDLANFHKIQE